MSGINVGHLVIPSVIDITLEISDDATFRKRMAEINAQLRFKHKIHTAEWKISRIGEEPSAASMKSSRNAKAAKAEQKKAEPKPKAKRERKQPKPPLKLPDPPPVPPAPEPVEVVREGSIAGEIDLAAARRLARS